MAECNSTSSDSNNPLYQPVVIADMDYNELFGRLGQVEVNLKIAEHNLARARRSYKPKIWIELARRHTTEAKHQCLALESRIGKPSQ
jgi:hypothetical protein